MNQFKECDVVMLPTNEKALINLNEYRVDIPTLSLSTNIQNYNTIPYELIIYRGYKPQHLYITSNDEIKEGDYRMMIDTTSNFYGQFEKHLGKHSCNDQWKKIIATTEDTLRVNSIVRKDSDEDYGKIISIISKPSIQFITKYIEEYNNGNIITKVMVEYEAYCEKLTCNRLDCKEVCKEIKYRIRISPKDNTITIKKVKDTWTKDEVKQLCWQAFINHKCIDGKIKPSTAVELIEPFNDWVKQNL